MSAPLIYQPRGRAREYSPWALNLFDGLCGHQRMDMTVPACAYCFAAQLPAARRKDSDPTCRPKRDLLARLERDCERIERAGGWPEKNGPVLVSFTTDPLPAGRADLLGVAQEALYRLWEAVVPVTLLSKNGYDALDWIEGWHSRDDEFATTIVFDETRTTWREWEAYAPPIDYRWYALECAHERGLNTWISVEPVIDPDEALAVIRFGQDIGCVGHYRIGPLNHHPHAATVDWRAFGERLAEVLVATGARYYLKQDMRPWMPKGFPADNREEAQNYVD